MLRTGNGQKKKKLHRWINNNNINQHFEARRLISSTVSNRYPNCTLPSPLMLRNQWANMKSETKKFTIRVCAYVIRVTNVILQLFHGKFVLVDNFHYTHIVIFAEIKLLRYQIYINRMINKVFQTTTTKWKRKCSTQLTA